MEKGKIIRSLFYKFTERFAVKLIAISHTLLVCASWIGSSLLLYTQDIFTHFALLR